MKKLTLILICLLLKVLSYGSSNKIFNGTDDIVNLTNNSIFNITGSMTITAWIYSVGEPGADTILSKDANLSSFPYSFRKTGSEEICFDQQQTAPQTNVCTSVTAVVLFTWQHFAGVRSGANTVTIYRNGEIIAGPSNSSDVPTGNSGSLYIGGNSGGDYFEGNLMDVRLYNRSLTSDEIKTSMRCLNQPEEGIVGHWLLMQDNDIYIDLSVNGNTGTCSNCPDNATDGPPTGWCLE